MVILFVRNREEFVTGVIPRLPYRHRLDFLDNQPRQPFSHLHSHLPDRMRVEPYGGSQSQLLTRLFIQVDAARVGRHFL